jgi:hypothetical protein
MPRRTRRYRVTVLTVSKSPLLTFEAKPLGGYALKLDAKQAKRVMQ